ncbi:hypothetical protein D3C76_1796340 [compost metagenome]
MLLVQPLEQGGGLFGREAVPLVGIPLQLRQVISQGLGDGFVHPLHLLHMPGFAAGNPPDQVLRIFALP